MAPQPPPPPPLVVTTVEVTPTTTGLGVGDTVRLTAAVKDQNGAALAGKVVTWSTSTPAVATVGLTGLVTAVGAGTTTIRATVETQSGSAAVTVRSPVASVVLSPDSATLSVGATLTMQVALRDAQGGPLTGRPIAWVSLDPTVASVSATGVVIGGQLGAARIVASAEGKADTAHVRVPAQPLGVTLEAAGARSASIGPGGGTLVATGASGVTYTLTVPARALLSSVPITMTPIGRVDGMPLSGGFVAGVEFAPAGLVFAKPASLTIATTRRPTGNQQMVGVAYQGAGTTLGLNPVTLTATTATLPVAHFSGLTLGFGTSQDLFALAASTSESASLLFYQNSLLAAFVQVPRDAAFILQIMGDWFDDLVLPAVQQGTTDARLVVALNEWLMWNAIPVALALSVPGLESRQQQWTTEFVPKLVAAIEGNKQLCADPARLTAFRLAALDAAIFWHVTAFDEGLATAANGLNNAAFTQGLCAQVAVSQSALASPLTEGVQESLDMTFGLTLVGSSSIVPAHFAVNATATGASLDRAFGLTAASPQGLYSTVVTPFSGAGAATISLDACFTNPALAAQDETSFALLCRTESVTRSIIAQSLQWTFDQDLEGWSPIGNAIKRPADGRQVARLDGGGGLTKTIGLPPGITTFEFEISAHDRPSSISQFTVSVTGPQGSATIVDGSLTAPTDGGFRWVIRTGSLALFAGQTVTIRIKHVARSHGQLYIDRIRIR